MISTVYLVKKFWDFREVYYVLIYNIFICNGRGGSSSGSSAVGERLLTTMLTEMDGLEQANVSYKIITYSNYKHDGF